MEPEKDVTTDKKFDFGNNCFDILRIVAAIIVVLSHSFRHFNVIKPWWLFFLTDGSIGVMIFFAISGFLNLASYERCIQSSSHPLRKFWFNRIIRIYPAVLVLFLVVTIFDATLGIYPDSFGSFIKHFVKNYLLFDGGGYKTNSISNGLFWTMRVELFFYILVPFVYYIGKKIPVWSWIIIIVLFWQFNLFDSTLVSLFSSGTEEVRPVINNRIIRTVGNRLFGQSGLLVFQYQFFIGALFYIKREQLFKFVENKKVLITYCILWFVWYCLYYYSGIIKPFGEMHNAVLGLITGPLVLALAYAFGNIRRTDISYGVYIYHWPVIQFFIYHGFNKNLWYLNMIEVWTVTIIFASASYFLIEKNALKLKSMVK